MGYDECIKRGSIPRPGGTGTGSGTRGFRREIEPKETSGRNEMERERFPPAGRVARALPDVVQVRCCYGQLSACWLPAVAAVQMPTIARVRRRPLPWSGMP